MRPLEKKCVALLESPRFAHLQVSYHDCERSDLLCLFDILNSQYSRVVKQQFSSLTRGTFGEKFWHTISAIFRYTSMLAMIIRGKCTDLCIDGGMLLCCLLEIDNLLVIRYQKCVSRIYVDDLYHECSDAVGFDRYDGQRENSKKITDAEVGIIGSIVS